MITIADIAPFHDLLSTLQPGSALTHGALTMIPLLRPGVPEPDWLTLAEAGDTVTITEVNEAGSVPSLTVSSAADRPVLLLDGEELIGAKQNRLLNTTVLVAAGATLTLPVTCVEQGRWAWRAKRFAASSASLYASLRAKKVQRVSESLRRGEGHQADQRQMWRDLASVATTLRVDSPTGAMHDIYQSRAKEIGSVRELLTARPDQLGALIFVGERWLGLDLLAAPGLFEREWPLLCAGYAADALGQEAKGRLSLAPHDVLERVWKTRVEPTPGVGLGAEYRLASEATHGAALLVDGRVAHLAAFPSTPGSPE